MPTSILMPMPCNHAYDIWWLITHRNLVGSEFNSVRTPMLRSTYAEMYLKNVPVPKHSGYSSLPKRDILPLLLLLLLAKHHRPTTIKNREKKKTIKKSKISSKPWLSCLLPSPGENDKQTTKPVKKPEESVSRMAEAGKQGEDKSREVVSSGVLV
jgi:hypothetical protein